MRRRDLLAASFVAASACSRAIPPRPNILLVIADDQSWRDAGAYGAKHVATPAFDRVAREGVLFSNSFCASPSCTPSRSAVLMGRHSWQQQEAGVLYGAIPPKIPLYTHLLEDAGYATGYTGKGWAPGDWKALGATRNPCGREYTAIFLGFLPGFAYCGRLDPRIVAPRLERPREKVSAGAVAVADGQTAVYPFASPGGWRLIGSTDVPMFDPKAAEPSRLRAGDRVRFVPR